MNYSKFDDVNYESLKPGDIFVVEGKQYKYKGSLNEGSVQMFCRVDAPLFQGSINEKTFWNILSEAATR